MYLLVSLVPTICVYLYIASFPVVFFPKLWFRESLSLPFACSPAYTLTFSDVLAQSLSFYALFNSFASEQ